MFIFPSFQNQSAVLSKSIDVRCVSRASEKKLSPDISSAVVAFALFC
jgi:hypothetical protein